MPTRRASDASCRQRQPAQHGVSLVELMLALALGLLVLAMAATVFLATRRTYVLQDNSVQLSDTGRYAIERITRAIRQVGYADLALPAALDLAGDGADSAISGLDARSLKSTTPAIEQALTSAVNGSDVLVVRFDGSADGTVLNCAGFAIGASPDPADHQSGWSIFYVARDSQGEPELQCKYQGHTAWASAAIARGVESFQVLYGVGQGGNDLPTRFITASQVDALDAQLVAHGATPAQRTQDRNRQSHWKKITEIKIALLVRSMQQVRTDALDLTHDLFGVAYGDAQSASDPGTRIAESALPLKERNRLRKIFTATIRLRNATSGVPR